MVKSCWNVRKIYGYDESCGQAISLMARQWAYWKGKFEEITAQEMPNFNVKNYSSRLRRQDMTKYCAGCC
jgi:hypothetical protein